MVLKKMSGFSVGLIEPSETQNGLVSSPALTYNIWNAWGLTTDLSFSVWCLRLRGEEEDLCLISDGPRNRQCVI